MSRYNLLTTGLLILSEDYQNSICNIYSIEGKLLLTKQIGVSTISTHNFSPGIYLLKPTNNFKLKTIKFVITH